MMLLPFKELFSKGACLNVNATAAAIIQDELLQTISFVSYAEKDPHLLQLHQLGLVYLVDPYEKLNICTII